jgi:glycosyltransferase involved in cell wall biosynthesis
VEKKPVTILTCARFEHFKDYESAIAAIKILKESTSTPFSYRIVGTGSMKSQVLDWIDEYGVKDIVEIVENPEDVDRHYREADIYFCSSTYEGLSNSVLEAMNRCLPIVSTKAGDHNLLAIDNETGFLVEVGDRAAMADRLQVLVEDFELRKELGNNAYNNLTENYSLEKFKNAYLNLIEQTLIR